MATQLQFRRGSTGQTSSFTGAIGEVTVDTDKNVVVVHDGTTAGGWPAPQLSYVQAAFDKANTSNSQFSVASFNQANAAFLQANAAFASANNVAPQVQPAFDTANSAALYANAAFSAANTKLSSSGGTISGNLEITGNNIPTTDNVYSLGSATNRWKDLYVGPGSVYIDNIVLGNTGGKLVISGVTDLVLPSSTAPATTNISDNANNAFDKANAAYTHANSAFGEANTKFSSSGGTISGIVTITQDLNISGNLNVTGNITSVDVNNVTLANGMIYLADGNAANTMDIGLVGAFTEGIYQHTGLIRDNADGVWKFFSNVVSEPTATVDLTGAIYDAIKVGGIESPSATINGIELGAYTTAAFGKANTATTDAAGASLYANSAYTTANAAYNQANTATTNAATADSKAVTAGSYANSAYGQANTATTNAATADSKAVTAGSYANSAYSQANTATTNAATADSKAVTAGSYANSSFGQANSAASYANSAFVKANAAFNQANTDYTTISAVAGTYGSAAYIPSIVLAANGRVSSITNTAFTAGASLADDTSTNSSYYPIFATATSGTPTTIKVSSTKLLYNPSTGTFTSVDFNTTSDINFKENVQKIDSATSILNNIEGVSFNWKETGRKSYGVIAQELEKILPELVQKTEHGLTVSYLPLIAILIEAVKEQQKQIDALKQ